jgi:hypothetical protein
MKQPTDYLDHLTPRDHVAELFRINMVEYGYTDTNEALSDAFYETFGKEADGDSESDCNVWNYAFSKVMQELKK